MRKWEEEAQRRSERGGRGGEGRGGVGGGEREGEKVSRMQGQVREGRTWRAANGRGQGKSCETAGGTVGGEDSAPRGSAQQA